MNAKRTPLKRLGSIAGLTLAIAIALVVVGGAPGAPLSAQRSIDASADLSITVNRDPQQVKAWDVVSYSLLVTNPSEFLAQGVSITVTLPDSEWVSGCVPPAGNPPNQTTYCNTGDIPPGATVPINLSVRVRAPLYDFTPVSAVLTASLSSATPDPNTDNNTATDTATVNPRDEDLNIGISSIPNPGLAGGDFTFEAVVTNGGPDDAYSPPNGAGVVVNLLLPPELTILSVTRDPRPRHRFARIRIRRIATSTVGSRQSLATKVSRST